MYMQYGPGSTGNVIAAVCSFCSGAWPTGSGPADQGCFDDGFGSYVLVLLAWVDCAYLGHSGCGLVSAESLTIHDSLRQKGSE